MHSCRRDCLCDALCFDDNHLVNIRMVTSLVTVEQSTIRVTRSLSLSQRPLCDSRRLAIVVPSRVCFPVLLSVLFCDIFLCERECLKALLFKATVVEIGVIIAETL